MSFSADPTEIARLHLHEEEDKALYILQLMQIRHHLACGETQ